MDLKGKKAKNINNFQNCENEFGGMSLDKLSVSFVRNVAPHKDMLRASFPLSVDILTATQHDAQRCDAEDAREPDAKKAKIVQ